MREPEAREGMEHDIALLLPWYLNGTLAEGECRQVEDHLAECRPCQRELEELKQLKRWIQASRAAAPVPSADLFARVVARIEATDPAAQSTRNIQAPTGPWWGERLIAWLQACFAPRWAPILATAMIVLQLAAIVGLLSLRFEGRQEPFETLSGPAMKPPQPAAGLRFRVAFQERASEQAIRTLLQTMGGRIIDGPSAAGFYIIEVAPSTGDLEKALDALRSRPHLIRFVERVER
ncbi:MAG: zf-HC2 domain-containing protein [Candidatus Methylomirabilis oxyfera]|nr:zf-HC2 domain-containing protein [Candidatus Methylomirabilis oxyfera]